MFKTKITSAAFLNLQRYFKFNILICKKDKIKKIWYIFYLNITIILKLFYMTSVLLCAFATFATGKVDKNKFKILLTYHDL